MLSRPRRVPPMTLRAWLVILTLVTTAPLAVALWHAFDAHARQQHEARVRLLRDRAESVADAVENRFGLGARLVRALSRLHEDSQDWRDFANALDQWLRVQSAITAVDVVDEAGTRVFSSGDAPSGDRRDRRCRSPSGIAAKPPGDGYMTEGSSVRLGVALEGPLAGCVALIAMPNQQLNRLLDRKRWPRDWIVSLIDPAGRVAARSADAATHVGSKATPPLVDAISGGSDRPFIGRSIDGIAVYAYVAAVPGHPGWHVAVGAPLTAIDSAARNLQGNVLAGIVAALLFACGLAMLTAGRLASEIRALLLPSSYGGSLVIQEVREVAGALQLATGQVNLMAAQQAGTIDTLREEIVRRSALENQLKSVQHQLLRSQEDDRKHFSRELHDGLGQDLALLQLTLLTLGEHHRDDAGRAALVAHCIASAERLSDLVRGISVDLRPPQLDDLGLIAALRSLVRRLNGSGGTQILFEAQGRDLALDDETSTAVYRIAQSGLVNAQRHAYASEIRLTLVFTENALALTVADNGVGFEPGKPAVDDPAPHLGLIIMRERVDALGGTLTVQSRPGRGTTLHVDVPLSGRAP